MSCLTCPTIIIVILIVVVIIIINTYLINHPVSSKTLSLMEEFWSEGFWSKHDLPLREPVLAMLQSPAHC